MTTENEPNRLALRFDSFSARLDCSAKLYKRDKKVDMIPIGEDILSVPEKYISSKNFSEIFSAAKYERVKLPDLNLDDNSDGEAYIPLEEIANHCRKSIDGLNHS